MRRLTTTLAQLGALLAFLTAAAGVDGDPAATGPAAAHTASGPSPLPEESSDPAADGQPSAIEPKTRPRANRLVYACRDSATPVFSDRPCGEDEQRRRLEVPSAAAGGAPSTRPAAAPAATRPIATRTPARVIPDPPDRCARLERELASIDARMRHGYSAREAARLWQRWRDAKARLRAAGC
jgi:hypothetical protein